MADISREIIKEAQETGLSFDEIAEGFGVSRKQLKIIYNHYGIDRNAKPKKRETVAKKEELEKVNVAPDTEKKKPDGVLCVYEQDKGNRRAQTCFYGGKCGGMDCCDYLLITGKRRPIDYENDVYPYNYCTAYKRVTKQQKKKLNTVRKKREEHQENLKGGVIQDD